MKSLSTPNFCTLMNTYYHALSFSISHIVNLWVFLKLYLFVSICAQGNLVMSTFIHAATWKGQRKASDAVEMEFLLRYMMLVLGSKFQSSGTAALLQTKPSHQNITIKPEDEILGHLFIFDNLIHILSHGIWDTVPHKLSNDVLYQLLPAQWVRNWLECSFVTCYLLIASGF